MPMQTKMNLWFKSVLGMTLNCIRWGSCGSGTKWCHPLPSLHPGPLWVGVVQLVRTPIQGTSWPARAQTLGLDSILGEHNTTPRAPRRILQITNHFSGRLVYKPLNVSEHATNEGIQRNFKTSLSNMAKCKWGLHVPSLQSLSERSRAPRYRGLSEYTTSFFSKTKCSYLW